MKKEIKYTMLYCVCENFCEVLYHLITVLVPDSEP
jgi:hypothetical protein